MTIEEIIAKQKELIAIKKSATKYTDIVKNSPIKIDGENILKVEIATPNDGEDKTETVKVIANTYYFVDTHGDVHVKGCFTKSIQESVGKIFHFDNHTHAFSAKVGNVKNVSEVKVNWKDLNIEKEGKTICLLGETELIEDYNCQVYDAYKAGEIDQHSVGMLYVDLRLAVNNPSETEAYKLWNEVYPLLGNPEVADGMGYFWVVKEAKLKEYSCVLWNGSNPLTPTIKNEEPSGDTLEKEPEESTQTQKKGINLNFY